MRVRPERLAYRGQFGVPLFAHARPVLRPKRVGLDEPRPYVPENDLDVGRRHPKQYVLPILRLQLGDVVVQGDVLDCYLVGEARRHVDVEPLVVPVLLERQVGGYRVPRLEERVVRHVVEEVVVEVVHVDAVAEGHPYLRVKRVGETRRVGRHVPDGARAVDGDDVLVLEPAQVDAARERDLYEPRLVYVALQFAEYPLDRHGYGLVGYLQLKHPAGQFEFYVLYVIAEFPSHAKNLKQFSLCSDNVKRGRFRLPAQRQRQPRSNAAKRLYLPSCFALILTTISTQSSANWSIASSKLASLGL